MDTPTLTPTRTINEQMKTDSELVFWHVVVDPARDYGTRITSGSRPSATLARRVALAPFVDLDETATVLGWVLFVLEGEGAKGRILTTDEVLVVAAARRLMDFVALMKDLRQFSEAMAASDAREARRLWDHMRPQHAMLVTILPNLVAAEILLHDLEAAQQPGRAFTH